MQEERLKLLMIESDPIDARLISDILEQGNPVIFDASWSENLTSGIDKLKECQYDVVLLNLRLADSTGLESLTRLISIAPNIPVVLLSDLTDESLAISAMNEGAQDYLLKGQLYYRWLNEVLKSAIKRKKFSNWLRGGRTEESDVVNL